MPQKFHIFTKYSQIFQYVFIKYTLFKKIFGIMEQKKKKW